MTDANTSTCLLVPSCDSYSDVWAPFFSLLRTNWPDCPYRIYLGSNHVPCNEPGVTSLLVGVDKDWSTGVRWMLEQLDYQYVLVLLEDFLLRARVRTVQLVNLLESLQRLGGSYLRLRPFPAPNLRLGSSSMIGEIERGAPYRCSLQAAFWDRQTLISLLREGESPWQFELLGARRSDQEPRGFYSTWSVALDYYAGVTLGKWLRHGVRVCRRQGVRVDLDRRPMMSIAETAKRGLFRVLHEALEAIPWRHRERLGRWRRSTGLTRSGLGNVFRGSGK
jgi:hypothetical protein